MSKSTYPTVHLIVLSCASWVGDLVVLVILIDQVLLDASRLKQIDGLTICESVRQSWNPSIGIDFQEPWLLLGVLGDINLGYLVRQSEFLQSDGDLNAIRRLGGVKVDIWTSSHVDLV